MAENKIPRVGIGCWIFNPYGMVLLGKRKSSHGNGTWAAPGGHLEFGEKPEHAAARELFEETNIKIPEDEFTLFAVTNDVFCGDHNTLEKHYITLHYVAYDITSTPKVMEPDKCERWIWFKMNALPDPLFISAKNALEYLR